MKELRVMYEGRAERFQVGTLADDGRDVLFEYSAQALERGLELSPIRLPLRAGAYPDHQQDYVNLQRVPGLLYDSLPDSWGFLLMNRRLRAKGINPDTVSTLDRLAYLGSNTMGALTYEPGSEALESSHDLTLLQLALEVRAVLSDTGRNVLAELARAGGSPGGARPKALVFYNPATGQMSTQADQVEGAQAWLIKFPSKEDASDSCALEELYARLARRCGLDMEDTHLFILDRDTSAFGTRRFDRDRLTGQRVHVHSLAGMLHANFQIPSLGYGEFLAATRRLTRDEREVRKALQRCVFNILMNNRDDHAKNLSFSLDANDRWVLAPPYDLTYCPGYKGEHFMDVAGEGKTPGRAHVLAVAKTGGLKPSQAGDAIDAILDTVTASVFAEEAGSLPVRSRTVKTVAKIIEENRNRLRA
jgi:serine/threonine-protein kinase HipA